MLAAHSNLAERLLPFLSWRRKWREHGLRGDLIAGVTVALVMIPQALAYAQLASLPPYIGLYACVLPAIIAALFGSCAQLSTGPVALTALLTGASLMPFARPDSPEFLTLAILLALMSGVVQLALGALRLGWLLNLVSRSVMTGFINAAALLICLSQVPALLGLTMNRSDHFLVDFWRLIFEFGAADPMSLLFGAGSFLCLIGLRHVAPRLPGVLLVVAVATAISAFTGYAERGGAVIGEIPAGLPFPSVPAIDWSMALALLPAAFIIGLVSFMEVDVQRHADQRPHGRKMAPEPGTHRPGAGQDRIRHSVARCRSVPRSRARHSITPPVRAPGWRPSCRSPFVILTLLLFTPLAVAPSERGARRRDPAGRINLIDFNALRRAWQAEPRRRHRLGSDLRHHAGLCTEYSESASWQVCCCLCR
jgi:sulfate permease, SulP family